MPALCGWYHPKQITETLVEAYSAREASDDIVWTAQPALSRSLMDTQSFNTRLVSRRQEYSPAKLTEIELAQAASASWLVQPPLLVL